ncbi:MAG TPA: family 78 glycoside hydrolase catalytic domain [Terracidiphilus sp.]|jgi:alpha-L-rhamnosidase|nr:family 78 glycoside hydrolase catalytic domain [Terracidiphilus sp.]
MKISFCKSLPLWFSSLSVALLGVSASAALPASNASSHLLAPTSLRCSGRIEPLAIAEAHPQFSWQLASASSSLHNVGQSAYQIQVFDQSRSLSVPAWDSGVVPSPATFDIPYSGPNLASQHPYSWRARAWDENHHPSPWSAPAHWTQAPDWHPQWISAPGDNANNDGPLPIFRKDLSVHGTVARALLYVSGLGQYELRLNGRKVGDDELTPGWTDYREAIDYDSYDVTHQLRTGTNALGVLLGNGMYRVLKTDGRYTKFTGTYGPLKCAVLLHLEFADGTSRNIVTDSTWKTTAGPITFSSTYGGEDYDERRDPRGWDQPGFNDASWQAASETDAPGGKLVPEIAPPLRTIHTYTPIKATQLRPGTTIYDFGQNFAGWPVLTASGPAGSVVKLIPGELLNPDGSVSQRSSGGPQWFSYTLGGGAPETWHPRFSYYGFRYVQVEIAGQGTAGAQPRILRLRGEAVHSSSTPLGSFESSDALLNRIHTLILRAIENNSVSLFTDCPHREKLGWLEESHLLASAMLYDFDFAGIYASTARNIHDAQTSDGPAAGRVPEIAPQYVVFGVDNGVFDDSPEWGSAAVLAPWYVYQRTGDRTFLAAQLDVMRRYVAYLGTRTHHSIVAYGLGDWYDIGPGDPGISKLTTPGVTATATYYQDLRVLEHTTALLGMNTDSSGYAQLADSVRDSFNARFFDASRHLYDKGSQTAQAMPLVAGLVPDSERSFVLNALVADIRAHHNHVTAGDVGFHYVVEALLEGGRSDVLYDMLKRTDSPSYGYQLAQGATSLTEAWDANPDSSQDHFMLGHAEEWFYRGLGGLDIDFARKGNKPIILRPVLAGNLSSVKVRFDSVLGTVESRWQRSKGVVAYDFDIPPNTTSILEVAAPSEAAVSVNGADLGHAPGIQFVESSGGIVHITVGSGHYHVIAPNPPSINH